MRLFVSVRERDSERERERKEGVASTLFSFQAPEAKQT